MPEDACSHQKYLEAIRAHREEVVLQIEQSKDMIARSQELLRRIDQLLAEDVHILRNNLEATRADREELVLDIKQSRETIAHAHEMLRRMDHLGGGTKSRRGCRRSVGCGVDYLADRPLGGTMRPCVTWHALRSWTIAPVLFPERRATPLSCAQQPARGLD